MHQSIMQWFTAFAISSNQNATTTTTTTTTDTDSFPATQQSLSSVFSCPITVGTFTSFTVSQVPYQVTITIPNVTSPNLCTLSLEQEDDIHMNDNTYIPIARTYDGNDWERAGGNFVSLWDDWICNIYDECTTVLHASGTYYLRNRVIADNKLINVTEASRFLEQATFGTTKTSIDNILQLGDTTIFPSKYIHEQIYNVPATLHRVHFRKRMNARAVFHQPNFAATVDPCQPHSTWRRRMISEKDIGRNLKFMTVTIDGIVWYRVLVAGQDRGYTKQVRFYSNDTYAPPPTATINNGLAYKFCTNTVDEIRKGQIHLLVNNMCLQMIADDFIIQFPPNAIFSNNNALSGQLASLNDNNSWKTLSNYIPDYLHIGYIDPNLCSNIIIPNNYNEITSAIFAQTIDGEWLIHEPRYVLRDNTVENPILDGGLSDWKEGRTRSCANVPRSYQNEHGCIVSTMPACTFGMKDPSEVATTSTGGTLVCGSPGEVKNDISLYGDTWLDIQSVLYKFKDEIGLPADTTSYFILERQNEYIWTDIVLYSNDQLRQRTAWVLYQIFSLQKSVRDAVWETEQFVQYYDIFVKHAFGNYINILREITYSPLMSTSLSYAGSKSLGYNFYQKDTKGDIIYPDENFAREIMQLFTIGLIELNIDGTPILDNNTGKPISTYNSDDIMSMARIWTGFLYYWGERANNERGAAGASRLDPLQIVPYYRDRFPKTNLYNGYIGDGYPLCIDLPEYHFLRKGAKYRVLGTSPAPEAITDDTEFANSITAKRMILDPISQLYQKLCAPNTATGGGCTYPGVVILDTNLNCYGEECNVDTVRTVQVNNIFYEYMHIPCVQQSYYENPQKIAMMNGWQQPACVPAKLQVAGEACCDITDLNLPATIQCKYAGERMSYTTAEERCQLIGKQLCEYKTTMTTHECPNRYYHWMSSQSSCQLQVKVNEAGYGAIVHYLDGYSKPPQFIQDDTPSYFKLYWESNQYPNPLSGCPASSCNVTTDNACLCNVTATDEIAFNTLPDNAYTIMNNLYIGHAAPDLYDTGTYISNSYSDYVYYISQDDGGNCCNADTVFEVTDHTGGKIYYKNIKSTVTIDGTVYKFRNPVQFNSFLPYEHTIMDAEYETEAVLQHLFRHKNTAPFVAYRFIQRFGNSNPSPKYVQTVAEAFWDGIYIDGDKTFGSGEYGDLAATVAAVLLYKEARSVSLTEDPTHGSLREPIIKVVAAMRALELKPITPMVELHMMETRIGQMAHEQPSVFSFFHPEFSPPGPAGSAALTAPEAEVMSSAQVVGLLNGLFAMVMHGLDNCDYGFGATSCETGPTAFISYQPNYASAEAMMEDLSILLTSGRLQKDKQDKIIAALINETDNEKRFKLAVQLVITSPEFHTTNSVDSQSEIEPPIVETLDVVPLEPEYKAVVHLFLNGGCDSFNVLTPHPSCTTLSKEYKASRGSVALQDTELLPIASTEGQPCTTFGLHNAHAFIKELYDDGDALFVANAGVMTTAVNKTNYMTLTETQLLAHNAMSDEVKRLDPFNTAIGTGVFGRAMDKLEAKGYTTGRTSIEANTLNLASRSPIVPSVVTIDALAGVDPLNLYPPSMGSLVNSLNGGVVNGEKEISGIYGETWSKILRESRNQTDELYQLLMDNPTQTPFPNTLISQRLQVVAQLIATHEARGVDRDAFFVSMDGYDTHANVATSLNKNLREVDDAIRAFVTEMKLMGLWENVVIVQTSEFGRTLTANNNDGTDHGWGGNYWIAGGDVKGGQVLGQYPSSLRTTGLQSEIMDRGRLIPTTPMDSIFNSVVEWIGLDNDELNEALPNRESFTSLFTKSDLFNCTGYC